MSAANPDRRPKQIDNVTRHASLQSSINSKCACHVASTVVLCGHTYVVSLVEIPAYRKLSGIKIDLVALVVSWIDQNHQTGVDVQSGKTSAERKLRSWGGQDGDLAGNASTFSVGGKFYRDKSSLHKI